MNTSAEYQNNLEKEPSDMEQDINYTRERIGRTVEELEQRLSPGQLMDQALGYAREHGGSLASSVAGSVRRNPLPLIVTAVGIMWLLKSQSSKGRVYSPYDDTADMYGTGDRSLYRGSESDRDSGLYRGVDSGDSGLYRGSESGSYGSESGGGIKDKLAGVGETIKSKVSGMRDSASSAGSSMGDRLRSTKDSLSERAQGLVETAQSTTRSMRNRSGSSGPGSMDQIRRAKGEFTTLMEEQPLLLGAVGMAIGATVAALVPTTRRERELMGSASDSLADRASELASQKYEELRETATQTVDEFTRSLKEGKASGGESSDRDRSREQTGMGTGASSGTSGAGSSTSTSGSSSSGSGSSIAQGMSKSSDQGVGSVSSSGLSGAPAGSSSQAKDKVGEAMSRTPGSGTSGSSTSGGSVSGSGLSGSGGSASRQTGPGSTSTKSSY